MRGPSVPRTWRLVDSWLLLMNLQSCKEALHQGLPRKSLFLASLDAVLVCYPYRVAHHRWPLLEKAHTFLMLIQGRDPCPLYWSHQRRILPPPPVDWTSRLLFIIWWTRRRLMP